MPPEFIATMKQYGLVMTKPGRFEKVDPPGAGNVPVAHEPAHEPSVRDLLAAQGEQDLEIPDIPRREPGELPMYRPEHVSPRAAPTYGRKLYTCLKPADFQLIIYPLLSRCP